MWISRLVICLVLVLTLWGPSVGPELAAGSSALPGSIEPALSSADLFQTQPKPTSPVRGATATPTDVPQVPATCRQEASSITPRVVQAGLVVAANAVGFDPGAQVTMTVTGQGITRTFDANADQNCRISRVLQTESDDPPGTYNVIFYGRDYLGDGNLQLANNFQVVAAPTPTNTVFAATPTLTSTPDVAACRFPTVVLSSSRVVQASPLIITGRGFAPNSQVTLDIVGPTGDRVIGVFTANSTCEASAVLTIGADEPPGQQIAIMTGLSPTGGTIAPRAQFEVAARAAGTSTPGPAAPTPTIPGPIPPAGTPATTAPVTVDQTLAITGGNRVPVVGQRTDYEHVVRITNRSTQSLDLRGIALGPLVQAASLSALAAQTGLTLSVTTDYASDVTIASATASTGQVTVRGASLIWDGQLAAGQAAEIRSSLQQTPMTAFVANQPVRGQSLVVSDAQGASLVVPQPVRPSLPPAQRLVQPAPPPVDPVTGPRLFPDTGFSVADDNIWTYYIRRGGQRTFGAPISRLMLLNGAWVQQFERGMLQVFEDGRVVSVNLLEDPYLPFEVLGDLVLPPVDEGMLLLAPNPEEPDFADRSQEYVREFAPEQSGDLAPRFYSSFLGTVLFRDAFFDGRGDPNLVPGFNLEIWGLPTSRPGPLVTGPDTVDPAIVLLRFQRGVMRHDGRTGATAGVPLGSYLRAILAGDESVPGLVDIAGSSPLWGQYNPDAVNWVARPNELAETNLVLVFTREDDGSEAVPIRSVAPEEPAEQAE